MAKYIALVNWTDQGIKNVKDSPARLDAARKLAQEVGGKLGETYLTIGAYDLVVMMDAPDDETMAKFALKLGSGGNVRTHTLKALDEDAYRRVIGSL